MKNDKCTDSALGELRHAYEIGALSVEDTEKFEIHLLSCESCYEEAAEFEKAASLMRTDIAVRREVRQAALGRERKPSFVTSLVRYLWPETPLVLKPAMAFFMMALLIYPAYLGMKGSSDSGMREIQTISLIPSRSMTSSIFWAEPGQDGLITFVFPGAQVGKEYQLTIETADGKEVMSNKSFTGFDGYETGRIVIPLDRFDDGTYRLMISDPEGTDPYREQVYVFEVDR